MTEVTEPLAPEEPRLPRSGAPAPLEQPHGASLTWAELREELRAHGFSAQQIAGIEASRPGYTGHRQCLACGAFQLDEGEVLHRCDACGWCRHAVVRDGKCSACGEVNPEPPELTAEHFRAHHLDPSGTLLRTEVR